MRFALRQLEHRALVKSGMVSCEHVPDPSATNAVPHEPCVGQEYLQLIGKGWEPIDAWLMSVLLLTMNHHQETEDQHFCFMPHVT